MEGDWEPLTREEERTALALIVIGLIIQGFLVFSTLVYWFG